MERHIRGYARHGGRGISGACRQTTIRRDARSAHRDRRVDYRATAPSTWYRACCSDVVCGQGSF